MRIIFWAFILGCCFNLAVISPLSAGVAEDKQTDREHMEKIRAALFRYMDDNGELPPHLSDLVPEFLADKSILLSPADNADHTAGSGAYPDPKLPCSYCYEFNHQGDDAASSTMKTKFAQMEVFGDAVPILRCFCYGQDQILNLSYGGAWYESPLFWETSPAVKELLKASGKADAPKDGITFVLECRDPLARPVAGVKIFVQNRTFKELPLPEMAIVADAQGIARIPLGPDGKTGGALSFEKEGYTAEDWGWEAMKADAVQKVIFTPARTIGGVVLNAHGEPLGDANVEIFGSVKDGDTWQERSLRVEKTDAKGQWTYNSLPGGAKNLSLAVTAAKHFKTDLYSDGSGPNVLSDETLHLRTCEVKLPPSANVLVSLKLPQPDSPTPACKIGGAFVTDGEMHDSGVVRQVKFLPLQPQMAFAFEEPGDFWALAVTEGYAPTLKKVRMIGKDVSMELPLEVGHRLSGQVLNQQGEPVAKAKISLQQMGRVEPGEVLVVAQTDEQGKFTWDHAPDTQPITLLVSDTPFTVAPTAKNVTLKTKG
jgi:hypothetical protein